MESKMIVPAAVPGVNVRAEMGIGDGYFSEA